MKVIDLIKMLQELPEDAEIGTVDTEQYTVKNTMDIYTRKDSVMGNCDYVGIDEIEDCRKSNKAYICDYYLV